MQVTFTKNFVMCAGWDGPSVGFGYQSMNRSYFNPARFLIGNTKNVLLCRDEIVHTYKETGIIARIGYYLNKWFNSSTWTEVSIVIESNLQPLHSRLLVKNADIKKSKEIKTIFLNTIQPLQQIDQTRYKQLTDLWA